VKVNNSGLRSRQMPLRRRSRVDKEA
jgi:hypothetical protein